MRALRIGLTGKRRDDVVVRYAIPCSALADEALKVAAVDDIGKQRPVELDGYSPFVATLFQHDGAASFKAATNQRIEKAA